MVLGLVFFLSMAALIFIRQVPVIGEHAPLLVELPPVFAVMLTVGSMIAWRCKEPMEQAIMRSRAHEYRAGQNLTAPACNSNHRDIALPTP
jgi:hypothetical protein